LLSFSYIQPGLLPAAAEGALPRWLKVWVGLWLVMCAIVGLLQLMVGLPQQCTMQCLCGVCEASSRQACRTSQATRVNPFQQQSMRIVL